jgi:flagellar basal body rod protein FlgG
VNPTTVMVDMIVSLRAYESSQRAIRTIDETISRAIDSAGQVRS